MYNKYNVYKLFSFRRRNKTWSSEQFEQLKISVICVITRHRSLKADVVLKANFISPSTSYTCKKKYEFVVWVVASFVFTPFFALISAISSSEVCVCLSLVASESLPTKRTTQSVPSKAIAD